MPLSFKSVTRSIIFFLFPRYPLLNSLTLLLLLAERSAREQQPPFHPKVVYLHVGLFFLCAVGMGFHRIRQLSALFHALHLQFFAISIYCNENFGYRLWLKKRMVLRMIGVAGFFYLYAYFCDSKPRHKLLKRIGEMTVGFYTLMATYIVLQSPEDKEAFLKFVPGLHNALFVYATLLAAVGLCYLPGRFVYDLTVVLLLVLTVSTCLIDTKLDYWTTKRGLDYWNQIRLLSDNVTLIVGTVLYLTCSKKRPLDQYD